MRSRRGFTLIEILIVMSMLSILAALLYPSFTHLAVDAERAMVMVTVRNVRDRIQLHTSIGDVALSLEGHPDDIDSDWFPGRRLPSEPWTSSQLKIQIVNGPKTATEPNNKTFRINPNGKPTGHTAWYNRANGSFCVKVPDRGSEQDILALFREINNLDSGFTANQG